MCIRDSTLPRGLHATTAPILPAFLAGRAVMWRNIIKIYTSTDGGYDVPARPMFSMYRRDSEEPHDSVPKHQISFSLCPPMLNFRSLILVMHLPIPH